MVVTLQAAQANLAMLIRGQFPGAVLEVIENGEVIAEVGVLKKFEKRPPRLGTLRGTVLSMEGFDDPLEEFEEYM
jgi:hypothetical protein